MDLDFDNTEVNRLYMAMGEFPEINGVQDPLRRLMKMAGLIDDGPIPLPDNLEELERLISEAEDEASSAASSAERACDVAADARILLEGLRIPERTKPNAV